MNKKYFFFLWLIMASMAVNAQVFTKVRTSLKGVMQPVMSWVDVNNNNRPDVFLDGDYYVHDKHLVISQLTASLKNQRFGLLKSPFPALHRGDAAVADYDKDGDEDIVMTGLNKLNQPVMYLYRNDGHRHFTLVPQHFTALSDGSVEWGDFDNDGDLDILVTGKRYDNKLVTTIYRNDNGIFTKYPIQVPGVYHGVARWGNFDNDGDLDILITGNNGNGPFTAIYINEKGKYYLLKQHFVQLQNSDAQWADFDGNGDLDFIISGEDKDGFPDSRIYSNDSGVFTNIPVSIRSLKSGSIDAADYDHDGDPDIVMTGESMERPYTEVYENEPGFNFKRIVTGIPGVSNGKALWGDFDHDGDMDLLVAGITVCYNFIGQVYRNNLNPKIEKAQTNTAQPTIPKYNHGPYYYYVFSSCFCAPTGGGNAKYHLYISNIHREKSAYNLNYKFNDLLIKNVPNWGKADRGHRTSNAFVTKKEAEISRMQVIESYKATGFKVHFINW